MTMTAYFDESGTHDGSQVTVFAGFMAMSGNWIPFSEAWREALELFGLLDDGAPGYFHMADFVARRGAYKDWTEDERRQRIEYLLRLINHYAGCSIGVALPRALADQFVPE